MILWGGCQRFLSYFRPHLLSPPIQVHTRLIDGLKILIIERYQDSASDEARCLLRSRYAYPLRLQPLN
jgi:hypothetical protein